MARGSPIGGSSCDGGELTSGIFLPSFKVLVPKGISIE
jgi:hypothetical protein